MKNLYCKIVSMMLVIILLLSLSVPAMAASDTTDQCTRAEFIHWLWQAAGSPVAEKKSTLTDVENETYYSAAVSWAQEVGIVKGYVNGTFGANNVATKTHMVTFLFRYAEYMKSAGIDARKEISAYLDASDVSSYAKEAFSWAIANGILAEPVDDKLEPFASVTRANAVSYIDRLLGTEIKLSEIEEDDSLIQKQIPTRKDIEDALVETAWAYYFKGDQVQYGSQELNTNGSDSGNFTNQLRKFYGGAWRSTLYATLEDATSDNTLYTVCSDYMWNVYKNTLDYSIFGHRLAAITAGFWMFSEREGMLVARYHTDTEPGSLALRFGYQDTSYNLTLEEMKDFLRNWEDNLRPGDILLAKGHTQLYIGNGYFLDATGNKYNMNTGKEGYETKGTIQEELHTVIGSLVDGTEQNGSRVVDKKEYFSVIRPLNVLCVDDNDGNLANDLLDTEYVQPQWEDMKYPEDMKTSGFDIIDAASDRVQYPGIEIDRTVSGTHMGTAAKGGTLTYSLVITNNSNVADYCTWKSAYTGMTYTGENYTGLRVTETVPDGTELVVDSVAGGTVTGDTITWNVDIPAGESVTLSYTVTVTADLGETIVNDGGLVGKTPSNSISNTVGGEKFTAEKEAALEAFAEVDRNTWNAKNEDGGYNISVTAIDTVFAERIYERVLGLDLELPSVNELMNNLFEQTLIEEARGWSYLADTPLTPVYMYTLKDTVADDYQIYQDMMVTGYLGGKYVKTDAYAHEPRINEFGKKYLEPGDIIIHANMTDYSETGEARSVSDGVVLVYLGNGKYAAMRSDGVLRAYSTDDVIWEAFSYDFFICLRPSQAYANINTGLLAYDMSNEPQPDPNAGNLGVTNAWADYYTAPLNADNEAKIANYDMTTWTKTTGNLPFAGQFYAEVLGVDVEINKTLATVKAALFSNDGNMVSDPKADFENYYWMLEEQKYYGGSDLVGGNTNVTLANLEIGDVLACCNSSAGDNESKYWVGVYQGNGKFAYADYLGSKVKNFGSTEAYTDATFAEFIGRTTWNYWFVFRPTEAFANLNAQPLSDANKAAIAALDNKFNSTSYNAQYAWQAYAAIGIDFVAEDVGNGTYATTVKKIFDDDNSSGEHVYTLKEAPDESDRLACLMLLHGYFGGYSVATKGAVENPTLNDLEIGDIVLLGMRTPAYSGLPEGTTGCYTTAVYQGNGTFAMARNSYVSYDEEGVPTKVKDSVKEIVTFTSDEEFIALLEQPHWQAWFVLRPSQAYDDINGSEEDTGNATGEPAGAALNASNRAAVAAYDMSNWPKNNGNLSFAGQFYSEVLGIKVGMDNTFSNLVTKGGLFADGTMVPAPVEGYENFYWMLEEQKFYGGSDLSGGNTNLKLENLVVGDVLACVQFTNNDVPEGVKIEYWVGVYQGNGQFASFRMYKDADDSSYQKIASTTGAYTDETLASYIGKARWDAWFVLRPSEAFDDINALAA